MKKLIITLFAFIIFAYTPSEANRKITLNNNLSKGEVIKYRAHWGVLTIGSGKCIVDDKIFFVNSHPCYKITVTGQTNGVASIFSVKDQWNSYIDTATFACIKATRSIREGNYKLDEIVYFDQKNNIAQVSRLDKKTQQFTKPKSYKTVEQVRDIVAGFMYIRLIDFSKLKTGDKFTVSGFIEDQTYNLEVVYQGREQIKVHNAMTWCHVIRPIMPENGLFDGKNSISVWISDDENQIPVKVKAKMFVGSFVIDLDK